jgi:hypothetical protein
MFENLVLGFASPKNPDPKPIALKAAAAPLPQPEVHVTARL